MALAFVSPLRASKATTCSHGNHGCILVVAKRITLMAVRLNRKAFEHGQELIGQGRFVYDEAS